MHIYERFLSVYELSESNCSQNIHSNPLKPLIKNLWGFLSPQGEGTQYTLSLWERERRMRIIQPLAATLRRSNTRQAFPSERGMLPQLTIMTSVEIPTIDLMR